MNENKTNINYYPGHMVKTKKEISKVLDLIDIVYEVIDARIPYSSKIRDINDLIKNKRRILIMTKKDLCNIEETNKWVKLYEKDGYKTILLDLTNNKDYKHLIDITSEMTKEIQEKRLNKGLKNKEIKALVIGIPNVGKSTLINKMVGKKVANVQNKPGVTKELRFLPTNMGITLLDTPGILWPKIENNDIALNIASVGSIKKEILPLNDVLYHLINIYHSNYKNVFDYYKVSDSDNVELLLENIAKRFNYIKDDEIDYNRLSEKIYNDFISGKIKGITLDICK